MNIHLLSRPLSGDGNEYQCGFVLLLSTLVLGAVAFLLMIGLSFRSVDGIKIIHAHEAALRARYLAHACVEEALKKIRDDKYYQGNETILFGIYGSCNILSVEIDGDDRTIKTQSAISGFVKKARLRLRVGGVGSIRPRGGLQVFSWEEVPDF